MLDIKFIVDHPDLAKAAVKNKRSDVSIDELLQTYAKRNELQQKLDALRSDSKAISSKLHAAKDKEKKSILKKAKDVKKDLTNLEQGFKKIDEAYTKLLLAVPNIPTDDTPVGKDEHDNVIMQKVGSPKQFTFTPKNHWEIGEELDLIDTEKAATISGSRFAYIKNELVLLEFAIISYVLSIVTDERQLKKIFKSKGLSVPTTPFIPILPPVFIRTAVFEQMDRLEPREDKYELPGDDQFLIGSAEHTLGPLHMNEILDADALPIRYIGFSTCFRREAGTYGKDMKGLIRMHQFDKLEMESFASTQLARDEQMALVAIQEHIMTSLELPYQLVSICTGDMGKPDARQIDLETWMPGQRKYRETHSADYMSDYQSRRLKIHTDTGNGKELVEMNDATAIAFSRTFAAILENHQTEKGAVKIPKVLHPYMHGIKEIKRD